ncbi:hypothetical protein [Nocardioides pacificus]
MAFIVALRVSETHPLWASALAVLGCLAVWSLFGLIAARSATNEQPFKIRSIRDESAQVPAYLLTYLFPFLFLTVSGWRDWVAYAIFAALLVVVIYRTDLVLVNPILLAAGYHVYIIESTSNFEGLLMATKRPLVGQTVNAVHLTPGAVKMTSLQSED